MNNTDLFLCSQVERFWLKFDLQEDIVSTLLWYNQEYKNILVKNPNRLNSLINNFSKATKKDINNVLSFASAS